MDEREARRGDRWDEPSREWIHVAGDVIFLVASFVMQWEWKESFWESLVRMVFWYVLK
jgi:hypothetical protein